MRTTCILPLALLACTAAHAWSSPTGTTGKTSETPQQIFNIPTAESWQELRKFDHAITRKQFESRLNSLFDPFNGMDPYLKITNTELAVYSSKDRAAKPLVTIVFAASDEKAQYSPWTAVPMEKKRRELLRETPPLNGLCIAIDPADIGGDWAVKEDRSTFYKGYGRVNEGDINLLVAQNLKKELADLGATVFLVRETTDPVCDLPAEKIRMAASYALSSASYLLPGSYRARAGGLRPDSPRRLEIAVEVLQTKSFEARARAEKTRTSFYPDITIVLQHNATPRSTEGRLTPINRNIFFVHGSYTQSDLRDERQRLRLLVKLFEGGTPVEVAVAESISNEFLETTGSPPVLYGDSNSTRKVIEDNLYVVARNIALNREHDGPVVVTEPYFMNEAVTLKRLIAGDYEGRKVIGGKPRISIFKEYAHCVAEGILKAYVPEEGR